jgi:Dolichyl-phosphate-mannose-protein mannosyltransferase
MSTAVAAGMLQYRPATARSQAIQLTIALSAAAFIATGICFRTIDLGRLPGVNADEAWTGVQAERFSHGQSIPWRTPTGNPLNVFFWGPEVVLHFFFQPSFALLRVVSVVSGIVALFVNYSLARRIYGQPTAALSSLLLTCLPIAIAYSRFGWDSSQTPLASALVIYLSLGMVRSPDRRRAYLIGTILALLAAIVVHPTNFFLVAFVAVTGIASRPQYCATWTTTRKLAIIAFVAAATTLTHFLAARRFDDNSAGFSLATLGEFLLNWGRLFSGATVYRYISAGILTTGFDAFDALFWLAAPLLLFGFYKGYQQDRNRLDAALALGYLAMILAYYVITGPRALSPHYERYSMCLVVPGCLLLSRGAAWWWRRPAHQGFIARFAIGIALLGLLITFRANYFDIFNTTGGNSHLAFRTARTEPKQFALEQILASSPSGQPVWIASDNWWTFWPLAYLAGGQYDVHVVHSSELASVPSDAALWRAELTGSEEDSNARDFANGGASPPKISFSSDASCRPVITLLRIQPGSSTVADQQRQ